MRRSGPEECQIEMDSGGICGRRSTSGGVCKEHRRRQEKGRPMGAPWRVRRTPEQIHADKNPQEFVDREPSLPSVIHKRCDREECGKPMTIKRSLFLKQKNSHCSRECARIALSDGKWILLYCAQCGSSFNRYRSWFNRQRGHGGKPWSGKVFCKRECWRAFVSEIETDPRARQDRKNEKRYQRYWNDPKYREEQRRVSREAQRRRRERAT